MLRHGKALSIAFYVQVNDTKGHLSSDCEVNPIDLQDMVSEVERDFTLQWLENPESFSALPALYFKPLLF
jgi:hypothetical protein